MSDSPHFKARFQIRTTAEGGLASPFYSGYFPLFDFDGEHEDGGEINILDAELAMPGDAFVGEVTLLGLEEWHEESLYAGADFIVKEKHKIVATGSVIEVY